MRARVICSKLLRTFDKKLGKDVIFNRYYHDIEMARRVYNYIKTYHPKLSVQLITLDEYDALLGKR